MIAAAARSGADVRPSDLALGIAVAGTVMAAAVVAVVLEGTPGPAPEPADDRIAVAIRPVARGRPGAAAAPAKSDARPGRKKTRRAAQDLPTPPPPDGAPSRDQPRAPKKPLSAALPGPDELVEPSHELPGVGDLPPATGSSEGSEEGEAAVAEYRTILRRWLAARFRVHGTGLPPEELERRLIKTALRIDDARTILEVSLTPSGDSTFDEAAREALAALEGQTIPAPPPGYPGPLQTRIPVHFRCPPEACD